jgi:hypothetical protein
MVLGAGPTAAWSTEDAPPAETPESAEEGSETEETEDPLSNYRMRFDVLTDRTIGTASRPVEFNWRRSQVHVAGTGSFLFELNNFDSARVGGLVRLPSDKSILEIGVNYAHVWDTPGSTMLALTPYRQPGRPSRLELDVGLALPLAEGIITTFPKFFPAAQLVFNLHAQVRYIVYPTGWGHMTVGEVASAIFSPTITDIEVDNLNTARLDAMAVDPGRYGLMLGFGNDIYFKQGLFVSPRLMLAVPLLAPMTQTDLLFWADFSLAVGVAF